MKIQRIAIIFVFVLVLLLGAIGMFCFLVPMNFYVSAYGRTEPKDFRRLDVSESGKLVYLIKKNKFKKGELLFELESIREQKKLTFLKEEEKLLKRELALLKTKIAFEKKQYQWQLQQSKLSLEKIEMELKLQQKQLAINKVITAGLKKQKELDEDLKEQEAKIFNYLYERKLLPKIDQLKIMYEKSLSKAAVQQAENRTIQMLFENEVQAKRLEADKAKTLAEKQYLQNIPDSLTSLFQIENRLLEIKKERSELEMTIRQRKYVAPFDGEVMLRLVKNNSFVKEDKVIMDIADISGIRFQALLTPNKRSEVKSGMKAEIYMDNYFFHKYGIMDGKVLNIQTDLPQNSAGTNLPAQTAYYVTISIDKPFRQFETGLTGRADIITFHGTIVQYLRQRQLGR